MSTRSEPQVAVAAGRDRSLAATPRLGYAWYVVGVLMLLYTFSFIDRQIFALLVGPLRRDLHITDTQMSLLIGFTFAVFYTFFGIPIGRLVDLYSRRWIIAIGLVLWSCFTAGCGLAPSFAVMLILRMGVGIGEAALSPAAYSLITDYFPRSRLATAISVYSMGIYIGSGLAYLLGGLIVGYTATQATWQVPLFGALRPWQLIFLAVGLPGLLLTPLLLSVRDPAPGDPGGPAARRTNAVPPRRVFSYILENRRAFLLHNVGFGLLALSSYSGAAWTPEFYKRTFHWTIPQVAVVFGPFVAIFGCLGIVGAGRIADALRRRGRPNSNILVGSVIGLLGIPVNCLLYLAPSPAWATFWLAFACLLAAAPFGVAPAAIQQMMPPTMRGQASAVYLFVLNLIGLGIGPTAVAVCTQRVFGQDAALGYSLAIVTSAACALAAACLYAALNPFLASLARLHRWNAASASGAPTEALGT